MKAAGKLFEVGMGVVSSLCVGVLFGIALDNIPVGLCLGVGLYPVLAYSGGSPPGDRG